MFLTKVLLPSCNSVSEMEKNALDQRATRYLGVSLFLAPLI